MKKAACYGFHRALKTGSRCGAAAARDSIIRCERRSTAWLLVATRATKTPALKKVPTAQRGIVPLGGGGGVRERDGDASVAVHCGCIAACATCANQEPHSTCSQKCFKCRLSWAFIGLVGVVDAPQGGRRLHTETRHANAQLHTLRTQKMPL